MDTLSSLSPESMRVILEFGAFGLQLVALLMVTTLIVTLMSTFRAIRRSESERWGEVLRGLLDIIRNRKDKD